MMNCNDLNELSRHLKQERLFIAAEREQLHQLNSNVSKSAERLYHASWISRQQKTNLDQLILASKDATPEACCRKAHALESVKFVDGYKCLSYHEAKFGEFLKNLRDNPKLLGFCLQQAERQSLETMQTMTKIIMSGLYGNVVMPEDETYVLHMLKSLIELQVAVSDNPRRLLRKGSCAFSSVFKLLNEGLFSAKLFLTGALHKPVMQLLMEDEWFYDIDPERALYRFPPAERQRRFGTQGTDDYTAKTAQYRELTANKLASLVERFIASIKNNMYCFPGPLAWTVSQLYHAVTKAERVSPTEAKAMCADLVLASFICPAICDPEPYGITSDAPISYIARHNLMQVAQVLQVLAISSWEDVECKATDLYGRFPKGCMSFLLDGLLDSPLTEQPPSISNQLVGYNRSAVLLTCSHLTELLNALRSLSSGLEENSREKKILEEILANIPPTSVIKSLQQSITPNTTPQPTPPGTPGTGKKLSKGSNKKRLFLSPDSFRDRENDDDSDGVEQPQQVCEDVMVVSLGMANDCPGMLPEGKVLEQDRRQRKAQHNSILPGEDDPVSESEIHLHEKRTRFSLSHDQDSIATSDNLEAISEAASSHSVGSDLDNENDNLSDMVSANVSGRGTPNISGRDTPLSQAESQAEGPEERPRAPDLPVIVQKNNREDVTDRFGKFEIKHELERDETKSTVSDTWSTDVLASDSEPPEQSQLERLEEVAEEMARQSLLGVQEVAEISETASDAWSTDVLASDTSEKQADRLLELDQDDVSSVSSSRGQAPEESDQMDNNEEAAQALGPQSPRQLEEGGAVGGAAESGARPRRVVRRHGPRAGSRHQAPRRNSAPQDQEDDDSGGDPFANSDEDEYKPRYMDNKYSAGDRRSGPFKFDVKQYKLQAVDGANESTKGGAPSRSGNTEDLGNSAQTLVPEGIVSPLSALNPLPEAMTQSHDGTLLRDNAPPYNGLGSISQNHSRSIDSLTKELTNGLKLTEQQNFNIDANRLSTTLVMFDPLSESSTDPGPEDGACLLEASADNDAVFSPSVIEGDGAKPREQSPSTPRISVHQVGEAELVSLNRPNKVQFKPIGACSARESDILLSKDGDVVLSKGGDLPGEAGDKPSHTNGGVVMREAGTGAACSADNSINDSSMPVWSEATTSSPARPEDVKDQADDKKQEKKKSSGFFSSFKERLSKGAFPVPVSVKGGKRKVGKSFDDSGKSDLDKGIVADASPKVTNAPAVGPLVDLDDSSSSPPKKSGKTEDLSIVFNESSDDILAKYRKQPVSSPSKSNEPGSLSGNAQLSEKEGSGPDEEEAAAPVYDPSNLESCKAFIDAKKKLRLVLSTADFQTIPSSGNIPGSAFSRASRERRENELVSFLKVQLAEAINLQDKDLIAQLHETIRCLRQFDSAEIKKLLKTMKDEYRSRSPYISYLVRCRQGLLSTLAHLDRLHNRVVRDKSVCNKYLISVLVRMFLEKRERSLMKFISEFQKLTLSDEKTELVDQFLTYLNQRMEEDHIWQAATEEQFADARTYIERNVMSHIYTHAMFPNGDGDIMRDQLYQEHMRQLAQVITVTHKDLKIPSMYHYECPWPAAQAEIYMINAYKTPKDKLQCVLRCSSTIMNLLSMANEKSVPAADDFMPVLIYVIIKAGCQNLLSTVQYVNSFYEKRLCGEEQYWWLQFTSAIEFIKTMDYAQ